MTSQNPAPNKHLSKVALQWARQAWGPLGIRHCSEVSNGSGDVVTDKKRLTRIGGQPVASLCEGTGEQWGALGRAEANDSASMRGSAQSAKSWRPWHRIKFLAIPSISASVYLFHH